MDSFDTASQITLNLNITGLLTIDPKNLEQLISGLQIQNSNPSAASHFHLTKRSYDDACGGYFC